MSKSIAPPKLSWLKNQLKECDWETSSDPSVRRGQPLMFFEAVVRHGVTPAVSEELPTISCGPFMDALWYCFSSPFHQFPQVYKFGKTDPCTMQYKECTACFRVKMKAPEEQVRRRSFAFGTASSVLGGLMVGPGRRKPIWRDSFRPRSQAVQRRSLSLLWLTKIDIGVTEELQQALEEFLLKYKV